jgi:hypothetical protein
MQNLAQFEYNDELAAMSGKGVSRLPAWRKAMYIANGACKGEGTIYCAVLRQMY